MREMRCTVGACTATFPASSAGWVVDDYAPDTGVTYTPACPEHEDPQLRRDEVDNGVGAELEATTDWPNPTDAELMEAVDEGLLPEVEEVECPHVRGTVVPYGSTTAIVPEPACDDCVAAAQLEAAQSAWDDGDLEWAFRLDVGSEEDGARSYVVEKLVRYLHRTPNTETKER